jgi:uncharacterized membrane protein YdbT with pleckstrin-like domain
MGHFVDDNLIPGEKIVYKATVNWMVYLPAIINVFLAFVILFLAKFVMHHPSRFVQLFAIVPLFVALYKATQAYFHRKYTEIVITDSRLIAKFGVVSREMIELPLVKIESVIVEQTIFDRLIGAGSVGARGTGMAMAPVRYIDEPIKFRNFLNEAISHAKQNIN